jgi:hypothetical protein
MPHLLRRCIESTETQIEFTVRMSETGGVQTFLDERITLDAIDDMMNAVWGGSMVLQ